MNPPAMLDQQTPLATVLIDVHATLVQLSAAADEQFAALADQDRARLEAVTREQERLAARLQRAESKRATVLAGASLDDALVHEPRLAPLSTAIGEAVRELQAKHSLVTTMIERATELNTQTIQFLQRLVGATSPAYGARGAIAQRNSALLDSRA